MNRKTLALLFIVAALSALTALPAAAFEYAERCNGDGIRWQNSSITFKVNSGTVGGVAWQNSLETAQMGWNIHAPGSNWRIYYNWVPSMYHQLGDGENQIDIAYNGELDPGVAAKTFVKRTMCWDIFPGGSHYTEADILISSQSSGWDKSTNPVPASHMTNTTLMMLHEHGHALGLGHENDVQATMNEAWPSAVGGPIGNNNEVQPLGDDARGARNAYGTSHTVRDTAASAVYLQAYGQSRTLPAPGWTFRNASLSFQFTILNRGTTDQTFPVHFYLSPTRYVHPSTSYYLGSTTISLLYARSTTAWATVFIPENAPAGYQYIGWYTDPYNGISESNEVNNGVSFVDATYISEARKPNACFTATPTSGYAPLTVSFNAGCTTDADGGPLTYSWDFGDGFTATGPAVSHTYGYANTFVATLTVTDQYGAVSQTGQSIVASCRPGGFCPEEPY